MLFCRVCGMLLEKNGRCTHCSRPKPNDTGTPINPPPSEKLYAELSEQKKSK